MLTTCPICLVSLATDGPALIAIKTCGHVMCTDCLEQIRNTPLFSHCHLCREPFRPTTDLVRVQLKFGEPEYNPKLFWNLIRRKAAQLQEERVIIDGERERLRASKQALHRRNQVQHDRIHSHEGTLRKLRDRTSDIHAEVEQLRLELREELSRISYILDSLYNSITVSYIPGHIVISIELAAYFATKSSPKSQTWTSLDYI
ncbi:uncharacterized protein C8Q71DRAFT_721374 [Rhodofomes roseus]|uniref:RING-type domain-containing protein n=1 Tax=Rhodofomes roseus TaxID=34475 RepID=A0ABQ8KS33_9APHY|nr:uncharacterized protein C8Q71DRAFT_721374 [Rhodofomes roseus]KAH9840940.1 hypothetical protein C8Q71DRAFT_721374 [Rhodofomes roseus]